MDILLIALLTLLNGAFAMSELALTASRKVRLSALAEAGDKGAQAALTLLENPTQFLSSVQVGITSIGVLNGIIGEAAFSSGVSEWIQTFGLSTRVADVSATALVVTAITFVTIADEYHIKKIEGIIHFEIPREALPEALIIEPTPFEEKQEFLKEIDNQRRKDDPNFLGAFHEKKKRN